MMKNVFKIKTFALIVIVVSLMLSSDVVASDKTDIYFFHGEGCTHCEDELALLNELKETHPNIDIHTYEVWHNQENNKLMKEIAKGLGAEIKGVPFTVIGDKYFVGYSEEYVKPAILDAVNGEEQSYINSYSITLPFIGAVKMSSLSLPIVTILMGILDGFNPCAMWILLFLISILIGMKNKKKMWVLGVTFILASGIVYFLFMVAWLKFALFIGAVFWVRLFVALVAIVGRSS